MWIRRTLLGAASAILAITSLMAVGPHAAAVGADPGFGSGGKVVTPFGGEAFLMRTAVQSDGKILAAGYVHSNTTNWDWGLARYNANGSLDTTFAQNGLFIKDFGGGRGDQLNAVTVQPDGKILVGGILDNGASCPFYYPERCWAVARLNADGSLDTGFGDNGVVVPPDSNPVGYGRVHSIAVEPDGHIIVTGSQGDWDVAVVRYNPDGSTNGQSRISVPGWHDGCGNDCPPNSGGGMLAEPSTVRLQPDGKILLGGGASNGHSFMLRFNADLSLDTSFGIGGLIKPQLYTVDGIQDFQLQPDGKIVITGKACFVPSCTEDGDAFVARFNTDGSRDNSFGTLGSAITGFANDDGANAVALLPDGKILLTGGLEMSNNNHDIAAFRFTSAGMLDTSFGTNGAFTVPISQGEDYAYTGALQPDGKLVAGGITWNGTYYDWALVRMDGVYIGPPVTITLPASGDSNVRSGQDNRNYGSGTFMRLQSSGSNRALVRFDQAALQAAVNNGTVLSAKLRLTITDNGNNWGTTGRTIDVHRLLASWAEGNGTEDDRGTGSGATWSCASDSNIANQAKNCSGSTEWEMGQPNNPAVHPWAQSATATQTITNNQSGVVEFDVTGDVANFANGSVPNYGWLIKKTNEGQNGQVSFGTRESAVTPELVVTYQP